MFNKKKTVTLDDLLPKNENMRYFIGAVGFLCAMGAVIEIASRTTAAAIEAL